MYGHLKLVYKVLNQTMPYQIALNWTMHIEILPLVSNDRTHTPTCTRTCACTHAHTHARAHTHACMHARTHTHTDDNDD